MVVAENTCTDLPLGDIEQLLMQISDDQKNAELFSDLSTSIPELQFQCDDRHVWLDADRGHEACAADPTAISGAIVTAECTDTELPLGDLEGLLLQIANDQDMVEPQSDLSAPIPHHNFNQSLESAEEALVKLETLLQELRVSSSNSGKEDPKAACSVLEMIRRLKKEAEFLEASFTSVSLTHTCCF